ncbi:uncharacterized protein LOC129907729 [Episyrphus balteatus]|uniref:uncharacterized protein LOC129907729 n=1 Tax=Episyrphus balteatus TaxID=286459 RepID=UPI002486A396|nr:uncharacterized protein LOC129907729 [Episyrphus balteatus]
MPITTRAGAKNANPASDRVLRSQLLADSFAELALPPLPQNLNLNPPQPQPQLSLGAESLLAQSNQGDNRGATAQDPRESLGGNEEVLAGYIRDVVTAAIGASRAEDLRFLTNEMDRTRNALRNEVAGIVRETLMAPTPEVNRALNRANQSEQLYGGAKTPRTSTIPPLRAPFPSRPRSPPRPPTPPRANAANEPPAMDEFLRQLHNLTFSDPINTTQAQPRYSRYSRIHSFHKWGVMFDSREMSVDDFIFQLETLKEGHDATWEEVVIGFHQFLDAPTRRWYWVYLKAHPNPTWAVLKNALIEQFRSLETDPELSRKLYDRHQGQTESFDDFYAAIQKLNGKLRTPKPDLEVMDILKNNVRRQMGTLLITCDPRSLAEMVYICRKIEKYLQDHEPQRPKMAPIPPPRRSAISELKADEREVDELATPEIEAFHPKKERDTRNYVCYNCKAKGHSWLECPEPQRILFCYGCGLENYTSPNCPRSVSVPVPTNTPSFTPVPAPRILQRPTNLLEAKVEPPRAASRPIKTLHERLQNYLEVRKRIFGSQNTVVSDKVSKLRKKFSEKKQSYKAIEATTLCSSEDPRPYATVHIFGEALLGLLDSGASISCLGADGLDFLRRHGQNITKLSSEVKTADGKHQAIVGKIFVEVTFKAMTKTIPLYLVPSLQQKLYLRIDFWKEFQIAPQLISEISSVPCPKETDPNAHVLTEQQSKRLQDAISLFPSSAVQGLGKTTLEVHTIDTGNAEPIKQRHYPISPAVQKLLYEELERMLKLGVIEQSNSAWSSPVVLVRKPGKNRLCLDYRKVNAKTKKDAYPLSHIEGLLSRLPDTHFISSVDLKDAFWQIPLEKSSREKTAFTVPGMPLLQFTVMPFGLCNAPQRMVRLMDKVVPHQLREKIFPYLNDLLVVSSTFEEHVQLLEILAGRLKEAGLTMNVQKSKFCFKELKYLGYIVGDGCLKTDPEKVAAIRDFPTPATSKQARRFLGLAGWYRRFVKDFSTLAAPITDTLKKSKKFIFTDEAVEAFEKLKRALTSAPLLVNPDFTKEFIIQCDASNTGIGCVLSQLDESGNERPIFYHSQKLNAAQRNYNVTERECLAAVMGVQKFRAYVEGHAFKIVTDHASLKWLMNQKDLCGRLARWSLKLQGFDFTIEHRKGSQNVVPDALSRVHGVDAMVSEISMLVDPCDVLHIDLADPSFKSTEYCKIRDSIQEYKEQLPDLQVSENFVYKSNIAQGIL